MAIAELTGDLAKINAMLPDGFGWHYKAYLRGGRVEHEWAVVDKENGGIHVHGFHCDYGMSMGREWFGGIEVHRLTPPDYGDQENPSHDHCWLLNAPCWHDGTSLGFSEQVAHCLPLEGDDMGLSQHQYVTQVMLRWFRSHFEEPSQ